MKKNVFNSIYNYKYKAVLLFLFVFLILTIGITDTSGFKYYFFLSLVLFSFLLFYYFLNKINLVNKLTFFNFNKLDNAKMNHGLFILCIFILLLDFYYLGGSPILSSFNIKTAKEITELRNNIHKDSPIFIVYLSGFNIKALLPFALFHFLYIKNKKYYFILLILTTFYAISMMQKSFIVSGLLPSLIFCIVYKKYTQIIMLLGIIIFVIFGLTILLNKILEYEEISQIVKIEIKKKTIETMKTSQSINYKSDKEISSSENKDLKELNSIKKENPLVENKELIDSNKIKKQKKVLEQKEIAHLMNIQSEKENKIEYSIRMFSGIINRVLIVPGLTVNEWFETVPSKKPFLYGDGYPIIAKIRGRKYIDYSKELFPILKPDYAKKNLKGTVNVASFVREYADFGKIGLVLGGVIIAFFMYLADTLFKNYPLHFIALNFFPILLISSSSILTIFFSGGWALLIFLFLAFKNQYKTSFEI